MARIFRPKTGQHSKRRGTAKSESLTLRQIRYFLALCEEKNFTRAARLCRVSQPSLTNAIKALETTLGGQLFDRKPFVRPSELAKLLRPHFESIVEAVDVTPQIVASISARPLKVASIGGHAGLSQQELANGKAAGIRRHDRRSRARPVEALKVLCDSNSEVRG